MNKSRSIPKELIKLKAHKIWKERLREGRNGTPESDWIEAKKYLEKHRGKVVLWKLRKTLNKLWKLTGKKVRASIRTLWKLLTFPFLFIWKILTFPFWVFKTLHSLFIDPNSRNFALEIVKTLGIGLTALGLLFSLWEGFEDRRLTQERLVTERFSKAVEQLGQDKDITVRIGGIYALERIAKDYDEDHWTIMEVLSSYVRKNSPLPSELKQIPQNEEEREQRQKEIENLSGINIDVQAVLTVIGRRKDPEPNRDEKIDLNSTNLQEANLGSANLQEAGLFGANLQEAFLREANLHKAYLGEAKNLTFQQIKSACNWKNAIYKGQSNWEEELVETIEPDNTNFIEKLKNDKLSDPKEPPNCSIWDVNN